MPLVKFPNNKKFTSNDVGQFANDFFQTLDDFRSKNLNDQLSDPLTFNLNTFHWMSVEAIALLNSILYVLHKENLNFLIIIEYDQHLDDTEKNVFQFIYFLIKKWRIQKSISYPNDPNRYFDIKIDLDHYIDSMVKNQFRKDYPQKKHENDLDYDERIRGYLEDKNEYLFNNYFKNNKSLILWEEILKSNIDKINETDFLKSLSENIDPIDLSELIEEELSEYFEKGTIKNIVTRELVENSIFHAHPESGKIETFSAMGFKRPKSEAEILEYQIPEIINFFKPGISYLEFTNIDFGQGLAKSLLEDYKRNSENDFAILDSEVIEYAFNKSSSRNPFSERYKGLVPRGLYDVINIVDRFNGVLIVRSNNGTCYFDCTSEKIIPFRSDQLNFHGTMFTMFLPKYNEGRSSNLPFNSEKNFKKPLTIKYEYLNLGYLNNDSFIANFKQSHQKNKFKQSQILDILSNKMLEIKKNTRNKKHTVLLIDFFTFRDSDTTKKVIHFLASDYNIGEEGGISVIVFNANINSIREVKEQILFNKNIRDILIYHPLLCLNNENQETIINFVGIHSFEDEKTLIEILNYTELDEKIINAYSKNKFPNQPCLGNLIYMDDNENYYFIDNLDLSVKNKVPISSNSGVDFLNQFILEKEYSLYIASGNYYLKKYIHLMQAFENQSHLALITLFLFKIYEDKAFQNALENYLTFNKPITFISITLSSQLFSEKIAEKIREDSTQKINIDLINLGNYYNFHEEKEFEKINNNSSIFLICDVISTGFLLKQVVKKLLNKNAKLTKVLSFVDTRINGELNSELQNSIFLNNISLILENGEDFRINNDSEIVSSTFKYPIPKFKITNIPKDLHSNTELIRISPFTNSLIKNDPAKINKSLSSVEVIADLSNLEELELIQFNLNKYLIINYLERNSVFHTYYINTQKLFEYNNNDGLYLIRYLLDILNEKQNKKFNHLLFPSGSGIQNLNFNEIINHKIFSDEIEVSKIIRENTEDGWKYLFNTAYFKEYTANNILILDDGSCTGSTLMQMINSILQNNQIYDISQIHITILSIFGRLNDHNRFLFSTLKQLKINNLTVTIEVFFGIQLNINTFYNHNFSFILNEHNEINSETLLPQVLNYYAKNRKREIEPVMSLKGITNRKIIQILCENPNFDIIKLLKWRNVLGKLIGFQVFNEDFEKYNELIRNFYSDSKNQDVLHDIQYILVILYHEKYFIKILKKNTSDVFSIIKQYLANYYLNEYPNYMIFNWPIEVLLKLTIEIFNLDYILQNQENKSFIVHLLNKTKNHKKSFSLFFYHFYKNLQNNKSNIKYISQVFDFFDFRKENPPKTDHTTLDFIELEYFFKQIAFKSYSNIPFVQKSLILEYFYKDKNEFENHWVNMGSDIVGLIEFFTELSEYGNQLIFDSNEYKTIIIRNIINFNVFYTNLKNLEQLLQFISNPIFKEFIKTESPYFILNNIEKINKYSKTNSNEINFVEINEILTFLNLFKIAFIEKSIVKETSHLYCGYQLFSEYSDVNIIKEWKGFIAKKTINIQYQENKIVNEYFINIHKMVLIYDIFENIYQNIHHYADKNLDIQSEFIFEDNILILKQTNYYKPNERESKKIGLKNIKKLVDIYPIKLTNHGLTNNLFTLTLEFKLKK